MKRTPHKCVFTGWIAILGMLFATLGPPICRAAMAGERIEGDDTCCSRSGAMNPSDSGSSSDEAHQSCPLHRISLIQLLPGITRTPGEAELQPTLVSVEKFSPAVIERLATVAFSVELPGRNFHPPPSDIPLHILQRVLRL